MACKEDKVEPADGRKEQSSSKNEINEYEQPEVSPYTGKFATLTFSEMRQRYSVPQPLVQRFPAIARLKCSNNDYSPAYFVDIDEEIGHTVVHYLYTGEYQTLGDPYSVEKRVQEYRRSVLTYCAAIYYGMSDLKALARRYMTIFEDAVDILQILDVSKAMWISTTVHHEYLQYLQEKLASAIKADDKCFDCHEVVRRFGGYRDIQEFVLSSVMSLHSHEISTLRNENKRMKEALEASSSKEHTAKPTQHHESEPKSIEACSAEPEPESESLHLASLLQDDCSKSESSDLDSLNSDNFFNVHGA